MILHIFKKDLPLRNVVFVVGEGVLMYFSVLLAAFVRHGRFQASFGSAEVLRNAFVILVVCQLCLYYNELYNLKSTDTYLELGLRLTRALGIASIVLAIVYYCIPHFLIGRGIFLISLVFLTVLVVSWRFLYSWILKRQMLTEKVVILGSGNLFTEIISEMSRRPDSGYNVAGVLSPKLASPGTLPSGIPVFSMKQPLHELAHSLRAKKIVVAMSERRGNLPTKELLRCKMNGIEIIEGETLYEHLTGKIYVEKLNPSWLIFSDGFHMSGMSRVVKRATSLAAASLILLLTFPLIGLIVLAIKLDSKGPAFFKQNRCGRYGRVFTLRKFRSMIHNAEGASGACWATDNDSRVTRVGRILRKYRLDEIPQVLNVLRGDMSFVGPRPERPEFMNKLTEIIPYYAQRHTVRPGITGWAQVSFRYGASVEDTTEKLKYDLFYVKNMSLAMDLIILWKTAKIVLLRAGAR
jgi:sugar transferase (PEP-CTERM system associated)